MSIRDRVRKSWFALLKHTLNRLTTRMARASIGPFSLIRHIGRRSGIIYETPLIIRPVSNGFVIELTYGPNVDWHKNVVAAGGGTVIWHGSEYPVGANEQISTAEGLSAFPPSQRVVLRMLGRTHFEKLRLRD